MTELQKANFWKRITAGLFDAILTAILAVGFGFLLSLLLNYSAYNNALEAGYARYEEQYGVTFRLSQEEMQAQTEAEKEAYMAAYNALIADKEVLYNYNMTINLTMIVTTFGILIAMVLTEFVVPLLFGNGQTLGKKIFGLALMRNDSVRMNNLQLFTRMILGKYAVGTMIPAYILLMVFLGLMDITGTFVLFILLLAQCVCFLATRNRSLLHDLMAGTVVVDFATQHIFSSTEDLIKYQKQVAAERAARADY